MAVPPGLSIRAGDVLGHLWYIPDVSKTAELPHVAVDVNYWEAFVHNGLGTPAGNRGSIGIFGKTGQHEPAALARVPRHAVPGAVPPSRGQGT